MYTHRKLFSLFNSIVNYLDPREKKFVTIEPIDLEDFYKTPQSDEKPSSDQKLLTNDSPSI